MDKPIILVVDDTPENLEVLDEILRSEYSVKVALNGEKALKIANSDEPPDLILLDIMMPQMDGYEVCRRLKADRKTQDIPIIFLTAKSEIEDEAQGLELGAVDYITKPIKLPVVKARIRRHLEIQMKQRRLEKQALKLIHLIEKEKAEGNEELTKKYEILGLIGKGGMAEVYKIKHRTLGRLMALKILIPPDAPGDWSTRFMMEAETLAKIQHPNVVTVHDAGIIRNYCYIVMEFVDGTDLEKLRNKRAIPYPIVHTIITQAAKGIAAVHAHNTIHRDIKPSNFLINREQVVKVTDFGLAKDMNKAKLTQVGTLMGTPAFMSPEQCKGINIDLRSDIYSLGITLFFLLTGRVPVDTDNPITTLYQVISNPVPDPRTYQNDVPEYFGYIVSKMTQKLPENRYQSLDELLEMLGKWG